MFGRKKPEQMSDLQNSVANGCAQVMAGRQSSDEEQRRRLMENYLIMTDGNLEQQFRGMSQYQWTDTEGVMGEAGKQYTGAIPANVAISMLSTPLIRTGFVSEQEARVAKWKVHRLMTRRKMKMTEVEYEEGGAMIMDSANIIFDWNINGAINGRIAKIAKSNPHSLDVSVGGPSQAGKQQ